MKADKEPSAIGLGAVLGSLIIICVVLVIVALDVVGHCIKVEKKKKRRSRRKRISKRPKSK